MKAFYSLYGSSNVKRLHILRDTAPARPRPSWRPDRSTQVGWCGTAAWGARVVDSIDDIAVGRRLLEELPDRPPTGLTWCPMCVGLAAQHLGVLQQLAEIVVGRSKV